MQRPDGQGYCIAGQLTIAIHGDEFDGVTNTGNGTELLCPQ